MRAREVLLAAVSEAPADVLLELARTFDPYYLASIVGTDAQADPQRALALYEEALKNGSTSAPSDVERLRRAFPSLR